MINISGFGLIAQITASRTFPTGFSVTEFADDSDPLDSPDLEAADTAMGLNGDLIVWSRASGIEVTISVIPNSDGAKNLAVLLDATRVSKGKFSAQDNAGIVFSYPDGKVVTCSNGTLISGPMFPNVASAGRLKSQQYKFRFEKVAKAGV